ncbi:hypothetical protein T440DRAFT_241456 [Plenodomus tracheiphilus IPT5]|uniref:Rhodopsin domain-containing protein n=1 Tax=Plenodomus tracheiphilus IPT5 TaxID=1408161 RepID=A0A6A7BH58_9PLEO|nr:hypothetical protein T440DRAFT_241456 [Plenodomus tracheiphilus IPT5]
MAPNVGLGTQGPLQRGWELWLTSVLAVVLAGLFVAARLTQRLVKKSGIGLDDYLIVAALVSSILLILTECQAVVYGYGRHYATLPQDSRITARKFFYGANIMYKVVLTFTKLSVVWLYYRIFAVSTKSFRTLCHIMNAWIVASGLAFTICTIFQCSPIHAFWDRSIPGYRCFKNEPWWISYATTQITTDFLLLAMPIPSIMKLSMGRAEKLGICLVFGTGGFVTFASIYRATTIARSASDPDPTWGPIPATIWSVIEANTGIICACLPMLRGPFVRLFGPILGSRRTTTKTQSSRLSRRSDFSRNVHARMEHRSHMYRSYSNHEKESQDHMFEGDLPLDRMEASRNRRGSMGIVVTSDVKVENDGYGKRKSQAISESQDADLVSTGSINERSTVKSAYFHI